jgi:hypothetical protein
MRKFKIRKIKTAKLLSISPEQDRVQMLTKFAEALKKYSPTEMPEVGNIRSWVDRELAKSLTKTKVHNLFK